MTCSMCNGNKLIQIEVNPPLSGKCFGSNRTHDGSKEYCYIICPKCERKDKSLTTNQTKEMKK